MYTSLGFHPPNFHRVMGEKLRSSWTQLVKSWVSNLTVCVCACLCMCVCDMREWFFFPLSTYSCSKFRGCQSSRSGSMTTAISTPSSEEGKLLVMCCCCVKLHTLPLSHIRESRIGTSSQPKWWRHTSTPSQNLGL